jgi:CheY-like chemotaxis protein
LRHGEFALVVIDPDLPDGDGHALIRSMRQTGQNTPVLLYSASQPMLHHQAHAFLPKPWTSPRQLWRTVSHMLGLESMLVVGS